MSQIETFPAICFRTFWRTRFTVFGFPVKIYGSGLDRKVREDFRLISSNFRPHPREAQKTIKNVTPRDMIYSPSPCSHF